MRRATRLSRALRIARAGVAIWLIYKVPALLRRVFRRPPPDDLGPSHERAARVLLSAALDLRGVVIKVCQVVATRSDVFPPAIVRELKQLHDAVPPKPFAVIREAIERELGKPLDAVFAAFDETPLASASLAQVHRARLHDGREVAVKVQYPEIETIVRGDLEEIRRACRLYERLDPQPLELLPLLTELATHLALELDFRREADSADRVREIFADDPSVVVPRIHREWSTSRVLVMELVGGLKVTDRDALAAAGIDPADVVQDLMRVFVRMILAAGFFQADPHPGNLFVRRDATHGRQLVLLDFGLSKELPDGFGMGLFELMFSMMTWNEAAMIRAFRELGFETRTGDPSTFVGIARRMMRRSDTGRFEGELTEEMTDELFEAIRENPVVRVPSDFVLVGRVFSLLSGIGHTLGRRANVLEAMGASTR
ncbi:MAG TPA: AarF/UbiB family protein [Myxococcota bacterium]|nr:AarF/UbiB family protein [Myxococcota bacterium]